MGLFEKKYVPLPRMEAGDILTLPHGTWEADYGQKRVPELKAGTAQLLGLFRGKKEHPILDDDAHRFYAQEFFVLRSETSEKVKSVGTRALQWSLLVDMEAEIFDRIAERYSVGNPFENFDLSALTKEPSYLHGRKEVFAWPFVIGHVVNRAEQELGWPRAAGKVDRRTWAALCGLAFLDMRRLAPSEGAERSEAGANLGLTREDEERFGNFLLLLTLQRAVIGGYRDARMGRVLSAD